MQHIAFSMEEQVPALHQAVLANDLERVQFFVKSGVDLKEQDAEFKTAFDHAVKHKELKKIAAFLYPYYFDLDGLQKVIGYEFHKLAKLVKAFTPRTICKERNYEIYEFIGDSILHQVLTLLLDSCSYETVNEHLLTKARQVLEQKETLAELSQKLNFDKYIIKSANSIVTIDMFEDVVEAIIAAIYKDGGAVAAQNFIQRFWVPMINDGKKMPMSPPDIVEMWAKANNKKLKEAYRKVGDKIEYRISCDYMNGMDDACNKRVARYYACRNFILNLPEQFNDYKERLIVSPLSSQYKIDKDIEYIINPSLWESRVSYPYSYQLNMIAQMLGLKKPNFNSTPTGEHHNPTFICTLVFEGLHEPIMGQKAKKTSKKAKEHTAKLAYNLWRMQTLKSLDMNEDCSIGIKKLLFLERIRKHRKSGKISSRVLLKELLDALGYEKVSYEDCRVGGNVTDPKSAFFYSISSCPGILNKPLKGKPYPTIKEAQEDVANAIFEKCLKQLKKE